MLPYKIIVDNTNNNNNKNNKNPFDFLSNRKATGLAGNPSIDFSVLLLPAIFLIYSKRLCDESIAI